MKILWLTNIPSPYRVDFFNELGKQCELTVVFEKKASSERNISWQNFNANNFNAIFLHGRSIGVAEAFCLDVIKYLRKSVYDYVFVTNFSDLTGILAIILLRMKRIPYIIESDGGFPGNGVGIKEKLKRWLLSRAKLYFSTAKTHDEYYKAYGAKEDRLVRYPFTSLYQKDILMHPVSLEYKKMMRKKLKLSEKWIVLAVGQFIPRKGYDVLIKAFQYLNNDIGCYIIGGKAPKEYLDLVSQLGLCNIHFIDFKKKEELDEYYIAADIFVHPTREDIWGLVINEAMSKGLPVITTERCIAGQELIKNEYVGKIVPVGDSKKLGKSIEEILNGLTYENKIKVLKNIQPYTIENMVQKHMEVL